VLAFLGISLVVIMTPGQDTALTIRNTLAGGRRNGLQTALGVSCGQVVWALAASTGLAALLAASEPAFDAIRLAGAAYLIVLGALALRDAIRGVSEASAAAPIAGRARGFRQGLVSNLGNPKMAVFFTGLLPQ
jgi:threonine/homoserine/homoserine lactone efflux protein